MCSLYQIAPHILKITRQGNGSPLNGIQNAFKLLEIYGTTFL